ncbi:hypothetical protein J6590_033358 [Homalodisca vitripennis]|nr:hypothetical protein J6590_033358 [Homalodisca vitripennis]
MHTAITLKTVRLLNVHMCKLKTRATAQTLRNVDVYTAYVTWDGGMELFRETVTITGPWTQMSGDVQECPDVDVSHNKSGEVHRPPLTADGVNVLTLRRYSTLHPVGCAKLHFLFVWTPQARSIIPTTGKGGRLVTPPHCHCRGPDVISIVNRGLTLFPPVLIKTYLFDTSGRNCRRICHPDKDPSVQATPRTSLVGADITTKIKQQGGGGGGERADISVAATTCCYNDYIV